MLPLRLLRDRDGKGAAGDVVRPPADGQGVVSLLLTVVCDVVDGRFLLLEREFADWVSGWRDHANRKKGLTF